MKDFRKENLFKTLLVAALLLAVAMLALLVSRRQLASRAHERASAALSSAAAEQCATVIAVLNGQYGMLSATAALLPADGAASVQSALLRIPLPEGCTDLIHVSTAGEALSRSGNAASAAAPLPSDLSDKGLGLLVQATDSGLQIVLFVPVPGATDSARSGLLCGLYDESLLNGLLVDRVYGGQTRICIAGNGARVLAANAPAAENGLVVGSDLLRHLERQSLLATEAGADMQKTLAAMQPGSATLSEQGESACLVYRPIGAEDWFLAMIAPNAVIHEELSQPLNTLYALSAILFTGVLALFVYLKFDERRRLSLASRARAQEFDKLSTRAQTDTLTGLLNRGAAEQRIQHFLANEGRSGRHALLMLDLDDFKGINDTFGHIAGDSVLVIIGERLRACIRSSDVVGRFGGDEFVILLKDAGPDEKILSLAEKIGRAVTEIDIPDQLCITATASIGIAIYAADGKDFAQLYGEADRALYRAKDAGKERALIFDPSSMA